MITFPLQDEAYEGGLGRSLHPESREVIERAPKSRIGRDVTCTREIAMDMFDYYGWQAVGFGTIEDARASTCYRAYKSIRDALRRAG